jgi:hypothetical protein
MSTSTTTAATTPALNPYLHPNHALTWSYYGMWHAEQGNLLKAKDDLEKVRLICGTECKEYVALKEVIDGTRTY